jgi:TRAP transporter 4TM/12TM fusion protein
MSGAKSAEGGAHRSLGRIAAGVVAVLAFVLAGLALYWTQYSLGTTVYRAAFLALTLTLAFLMYPVWERRWRDQVWLIDLALIGVSIWALVYLATNLEAIKMRATTPTPLEAALGIGLIIAVLEATRRSIGWILPAVAAVFLVYAVFGPWMPAPLDHRGYSVDRIVGMNYLTLEGLFSTPLDVAATFIVLFTLYGAVLDRSGAGKFYIDWAFALFGKKPSASAPGRAVVASGFLLGTVSGSGVATTVTLSSLAWPMLRQSGYPPAVAGGLMSAAGIGALLSPPTLGAAAFIIAEYLKISYADVLIMAIGPTLLYYVSAWAMVEADARRLGVAPVKTSDLSLIRLTQRHGYHFISLIAIAVLLFMGVSAFMAVFWSIALAFALSLIDPSQRLTPLWCAGVGLGATLLALLLGERASAAVFWGLVFALAPALILAGFTWRKRTEVPAEATRFAGALVSGSKDVVAIAATCATAGIIVSVINLTGLGLKISGLIGDWGQGSLFLTILFAAIAMWVLGAAVPVTASYIIGAVVLAPALINAGVPEPAAHMFLFYYAVLGDVSPPTALAPFAAAAITGGKPFETMGQAWKYCLPAFVAPFMFCLTPDGMGLLLEASWAVNAQALFTAVLGVVALAGAFGGWMLARALAWERVAMGAAGLALMYAGTWSDIAGAAVGAAVLVAHWVRVRNAKPA